MYSFQLYTCCLLKLHEYQNLLDTVKSICIRFTLLLFAGYGNVSPRTEAGRAATVAYAAAGVPLTLACLAGLGASLAKLARLGWLRATKRKVPNSWRRDGEVRNYEIYGFYISSRLSNNTETSDGNRFCITIHICCNCGTIINV